MHGSLHACEDRQVSDDELDPILGQVEWPTDHPAWRSPYVANQVAFQLAPGPDGETPDTVVLSFGYFTTPTLAGTPEEQNQKLRGAFEAGDRRPLLFEIQPQARVVVTIAQARRMHEALGGLLERLDEANEGDES